MAPDAGAPVPFETLMEGAEPGPGEAPDLSAALRRIKEVARVLGSFATLRDPARPRADYVDQVPLTPVVGPPLDCPTIPWCRAALPRCATRRRRARTMWTTCPHPAAGSPVIALPYPTMTLP